MDLILDALQSQVSPDVVVYADAAVPLRPGVRFLPTLARGEWGSITQARSGFAAVSLLGLYAVIVSRWVGEAIAGTWSGGAASVMAVQMLPIIASLQIVSPLRAQALRDRRQPDGRRRGVFIAPEGIVIFEAGRWSTIPFGSADRLSATLDVRPARRWFRQSWDLVVTVAGVPPLRVEVDGAVTPIAEGRSVLGVREPVSPPA